MLFNHVVVVYRSIPLPRVSLGVILIEALKSFRLYIRAIHSILLSIKSTTRSNEIGFLKGLNLNPPACNAGKPTAKNSNRGAVEYRAKNTPHTNRNSNLLYQQAPAGWMERRCRQLPVGSPRGRHPCSRLMGSAQPRYPLAPTSDIPCTAHKKRQSSIRALPFKHIHNKKTLLSSFHFHGKVAKNWSFLSNVKTLSNAFSSIEYIF